MISDLNKHRFEYIWHLYSNNISDTDLPFHKHVKCDPSVWQFPEHLVEYHRLIFGLGYTSLKDKKVLDIGCGISWYLGSMENIVKKYIGVDTNERRIKYAKIMSKIVDIDTDINVLPAEAVSCKVDTIMMLSVTHFIPKVKDIFKNTRPQKVVNLAAQAGVRYSLENPLAYINSNIVGFANILENCRFHKIEHLVYASTSSVYGANTKMPFSEHDSVNHPLSIYAATKKSNELMAHAYSYLYKLPTTGLRFFTVYGPWGRPDMALFKFTQAIIEGKTIDVFNHGKHARDFTYIDDIVEGV